jgi:hypothetical protein
MGPPDRFRPPVCRRQERRPIPAAGDACAHSDPGSKAGCRRSDGQAVPPSLDIGRRFAREDRRMSQPAPVPPAIYPVGACAKNATGELLRGIEPRSTLQRAHARGEPGSRPSAGCETMWWLVARSRMDRHSAARYSRGGFASGSIIPRICCHAALPRERITSLAARGV